MKQGRTLTALAAELERQRSTKKDYKAPSTLMSMESGSKLVMMRSLADSEDFNMTRLCHQQVAEALNIPQKFYDHLQEKHPVILDYTVSKLFRREPATRLIRTIDGNARAFLSDRYRPLDNYDLAEAILPVFQENDGYRVESCEITEKKLYIKIISDRIQARVVGDTVQSGIVVSNSEVGCGSLKVEPLLFTLSCLNGAIANEYGMRRFHIGKKDSEIEAVEEYFADETKRADDKAFWLKVRDVVRGSFDQVRFDRLVHKLNKTNERAIDGDPAKVVEVVAKRYALNDDERGGVLKHLSRGGNLSQYGLLNAVTRQAQDVDDYERATELERLGGEILDLTESQFDGMMGEAELVQVR